MQRPIVTLTLNPALDMATATDRVVAGPKLRCDAPRSDPGGGGVNVSRVITRLGGQVRTLVALGGSTGARLETLLAAEGIRVEALPMPGETRISLAVTAREDGAQFRFVLPGPSWSEHEIELALARLGEAVGDGALVVVSGSLPPGLDHTVILRLNALITGLGASMVLDTSGAALIGAVRATPAPFGVLRMDGDEARELAGRALESRDALVAFARDLVAQGVADTLVMGMGAEGSLAVSAHEAFQARPPAHEVVSAIGAGDSLVGAFTLTLARGGLLRDALATGTAAAAATVTTAATDLCDPAKVDALRAGTEIIDL